MKKSNKIQLYCYTHMMPEYGLVDDEMHTPLHVGKELHKDVEICETCDNTGDNISILNDCMRELTGMYWVWKNVKDVKYVGSEHYRRRFGLSYKEISSILNKKEIITFKPTDLGNQTLQFNYFMCHSYVDFVTIEYIVKRFFPDYISDWDKYMNNGNILYPANCFICEKEKFDKACEFVFGVLNVFLESFFISNKDRLEHHVQTFSQPTCPPDKEKIGWDWVKYQQGICGFLAERLFTLYILHNFPKESIYEADKIEMEDIFGNNEENKQ